MSSLVQPKWTSSASPGRSVLALGADGGEPAADVVLDRLDVVDGLALDLGELGDVVRRRSRSTIARRRVCSPAVRARTPGTT